MVTTSCLLLFILITLGHVTCQDPDGGGTKPQQTCPPGYFGTNCTGECHCLNGPDQCEQAELQGYCLDYQCDRGWTGKPYCQEECVSGRYGSNCAFECHCPVGDTCDRVSGRCNSGQCHPEYTGAGCQIRLPRLITAPQVVNVSCGNFTVFWRAWIKGNDIGDPPVGWYTLQEQVNGSDWTDYQQVDGRHGDEVFYIYRTEVSPADVFRFRVRVDRDDDGKQEIGGFSPVSVPVMAACPAPTTTQGPTTTVTTVEVTTAGATTAPPTTEAPTTQPSTRFPVTTQPQSTTTTQPPRAPQAVSNITVTFTEEGEVMVVWNAPDGDPAALYANITYQKLSTGDCQPVVGDVLTTTVGAPLAFVQLPAMDRWARYRVTVIVVNAVGPSPATSKEFNTQEQAPDGTVTNVGYRSLSARSLTFAWSPVPCPNRGGVFVRYNLDFYDVTSGKLHLQTSTRDEGYKLTGLLPYTTYGVRISYVNKIQAGPASEMYNVTTLESAPPAPTDVLSLDRTDTTIRIRWSAPTPPNGQLLTYRIFYKREGGTIVNTVDHPDIDTREREITGLDPYTVYVIEVEAETNGGWGNRSAPLIQRTEEGIPGAPRELKRESRNTTCLRLTWREPSDPNGVIRKYKITSRVITTYSVNEPAQRTIEIETNSSHTVCSLMPGSLYKFSLSAGTQKGYGPSVDTESWTEVGDPQSPPRPTIDARGNTYINLTLQPVVLQAGPVTSFYLVVDDKEEEAPPRRKRNPVDAIPLPGYTAAEIDPIRTATRFVLGDGKKYKVYTNIPLKAGSKYDIFYVVKSSLDGVTKYGYEKMEVATSSGPGAPGPSTGTEGSTGLILMIALPIIGLIILIIVVIVLFMLLRKRGKQKGLPVKNNKEWLTYYQNNYTNSKDTLQSRGGNWSDTHDLDESRHVTLKGKNYEPVDLQVAALQGKRPTISFEAEYRNLPTGRQYPWRVAEKPENEPKNRFDHLMAYDHSRVVLHRSKGSDYINANYIHGYGDDKQNAYIACQSPHNDITTRDFWEMIYQENCSKVVFLANLLEDGIMKSEQYWPTDGVGNYGVTTVRHVRTEDYANFVIRTFDLSKTGEGTKRVTQYQFTEWPEHGVPDDPIPFLEFRMKVKTDLSGDNGPMVVHCGTGVSRAAVFIAVDSLLEQAQVENAVNVFRFCNRMRRCRVMMVRTLKQYIFIYESLFEALLTSYHIVGDDLRTNYRLLSNVNPVTDKSYFREQFEVLEDFTPKLTDAQCSVGIRVENKKKNRFPGILPPDEHRPVLRTPGGLGRTDYINALYLDSYLDRDKYVVTQTPLQSTIIDFWKLVYDHDVTAIVMLNNEDFKEETCADYWPHQPGTQRWEPFFVDLRQVERVPNITIRTMILHNAQKPSEPGREIKHYQFGAWPMYNKVPDSREAMMELVDLVEQWQEDVETQDCPVLVHCMDGASRSGLYCACAILSEKMRLEGEVDVFHTVKHMKRRRPHFISTPEQYKFCFKFLWDYMNTRMNLPNLSNGHVTFGST